MKEGWVVAHYKLKVMQQQHDGKLTYASAIFWSSDCMFPKADNTLPAQVEDVSQMKFILRTSWKKKKKKYWISKAMQNGVHLLSLNPDFILVHLTNPYARIWVAKAFDSIIHAKENKNNSYVPLSSSASTAVLSSKQVPISCSDSENSGTCIWLRIVNLYIG